MKKEKILSTNDEKREIRWKEKKIVWRKVTSEIKTDILNCIAAILISIVARGVWDILNN